MDEVNRTLFIPLCGKSLVSRKGIILRDPDAERIWEAEGFPLPGRSRSKWLAYNMAMRARVFDDWTDAMLEEHPDALVLHLGCGLDSRCARVKKPYKNWIDCDFPGVIAVRRRYFREGGGCRMAALDASDPAQLKTLPDAGEAILILEGISMYLTQDELRALFRTLEAKYARLYVLMDVYTELGAKASKYTNPVNDVGVTRLYGVDDIGALLEGLRCRFRTEHSFTPPALTAELKPAERFVFRLLYTGKLYRRFYRLLELEAAPSGE